METVRPIILARFVKMSPSWIIFFTCGLFTCGGLQSRARAPCYDAPFGAAGG
jgi:hypothetical protein